MTTAELLTSADGFTIDLTIARREEDDTAKRAPTRVEENRHDIEHRPIIAWKHDGASVCACLAARLDPHRRGHELSD